MSRTSSLKCEHNSFNNSPTSINFNHQPDSHRNQPNKSSSFGRKFIFCIIWFRLRNCVIFPSLVRLLAACELCKKRIYVVEAIRHPSVYIQQQLHDKSTADRPKANKWNTKFNYFLRWKKATRKKLYNVFFGLRIVWKIIIFIPKWFPRQFSSHTLPFLSLSLYSPARLRRNKKSGFSSFVTGPYGARHT